MAWLELDADGEIVRIVVDNSGGLPPGHAWLEAEVPADYPRDWRWDADEASFVPTTANRLHELRYTRAARLAACDWTQLPDSPLTGAKRAEWAAYRQALRDLPETADPLDFEWPEPPAS